MDTIIFQDWDNYTLNGTAKVMDWNNVRRLPSAIPLTALTSALQERVDIVREFYRNSFDIPTPVPVPTPLISLRNYCLKTNYVYNPRTIPDLLQALSPFFIDAGEDIVAIKSKIETITGIPYIEEQLFTPITKELFNQWRVWMGLLNRFNVMNRNSYAINLIFYERDGGGLTPAEAENNFLSNTWSVRGYPNVNQPIGVWVQTSNTGWNSAGQQVPIYYVRRYEIKDVVRSISINASKSIILTGTKYFNYNFPNTYSTYENPDTLALENVEHTYLSRPPSDISLASNILDTTLDYETVFPNWIQASVFSSFSSEGVNGFNSSGGEWGFPTSQIFGSWKLIYDFNVPNGFKFV